MPCDIRMKRTFLQGLLWLYLFGFGFMALSLEPGVSLYLDFDNLPDTNFSCVGKVIGGYYADLETNCQMFHVCTIGQLDEPMDIRFLCLNGTVFDQETRVCERIDEVDCSKSEQFYSLNLELYGNTQPATLEESPETEQPLIIKSTAPTTTTSTTSTTTTPPTSRTQPFYTTATTPRATSPSPQVISTHHFPVVNSPDIRFDPEEINISLRPGAPPDIRTKPAFEHGFSDGADNKKVVVTTHGDSNSDNKRIVVTTATPAFGEGGASQRQQQQQQQQQQQGGFIERPQVQAQQAPQKNFNRPTPGDINFGFTFHQTEPGDDYRTDNPQQPYHFHSDYRPSQEFSGHQHHRHNPLGHQFQSSTFQDDYSSTTSKVNNNNFQQKVPTTPGNFFLQSLTPPAPNQHHHYSQHASRTDKPQRLQLPLPLLPTLPPLTFSSPAPFALQRHIETKRYTKDHQAPPRIIISASASVSDASGRRLNYSLGSFDAGEILEDPPSPYDEYKESDLSLDPFYHDVPKIKHSRRRRAVEDRPKPLNVIKNEREAETVLKFLVEWYEEKTIKTDPTINKLIKDSRIKRQAPSKIRHSDIIRNEQEAIDVLRFLLEWYKDHERSSTVPTISSTDVKEEVTSTTKSNQVDSAIKSNVDEDYVNFANSDLFNKNSKFSIVGNHAPSTGKRTNDVSRNPDEDYVNDNFEPITYNEKYGKTDNRKLKLKHEEIKNKSLPTDYVDDNVEPIYYRDSGASKQDSVADNTEESSNVNSKILDQLYHDIKELNDALLDTKMGESKEKVSVRNGDTKTNNINNISGYINHDIKELNDALLSPVEVEKVEEKPLAKSVYIKIDHLNNKVTAKINHASKELNDALLPAHIDENPLDQRYDPETNNINKKVEEDRSPPRSTLITPRFEVTTSSAEKTTAAGTSINRTSRRRGRGRQHNAVTNSSTTKSKQNKNVVIEKITEKAHTAKDDFNYLRTLYKVLSTTPMYNISEEANPYVKLKKVTNSQQDSDLFSQNFDFGETGYGEDKTQSESQNVPIVTTEEAVTSTTSRVGRRRGRAKTQTTKAIHHGRRRTTQPTQQSATDTAFTSEQTSPNERDSSTRSEETVTQTVNGSGGLLGERNIQTSTTAYGLVPRSEIAEPTTTVSPIPTVTPLTDDVETQTSFFNELTHNYKRLFEVLTSAGPDDQPSTTLANSKRGYVTSHNPTTQSLDTLLKRTLSVSATTDLPKQQRTTISPADTTHASILPPTTELPNVETESVRPSNAETTEQSTLPVTTATTQKEISTTEGTSVVQTPATIPTTLSELYKVVNIETVGKIVLQPIKDVVPNEKPHVKSYRRANRKETESTTQQLESATTKTQYVKADNDATTVADPMQIKLYRRFNKKDTDFATKQYIGTTTIPTTEVDTTVSYPKVSYYGKVNKEEPESTTKLTFEITGNPHFPFDFTIYPTSSSQRRTTTEEIFETTTTENIPTTRETFLRFSTTDIDDDDDEELAESNKAVGGKPKEHVLQENRHFLSSFTQSFSYTEEMDKDTPTIQETEILTREVQEGVPIPPTTIPEETTSTIDLTTDPILETETYPSILVVTTTRTTTTTTPAPTTTESHNKLEGTTYIPTTKMTTEKMIRFIKDVEATTKSVAISTELPPTTTAATTERTETTTDTVISTTEQTETLQELVHEIEDMTKSKIGTTTYEVMSRRRGRPQTTESTTSSQLSTTQEVITWPSTARHEELVTQQSETTSTDENRLSSTVQTPSDTTTENSITTPQATTLEEKATKEAPVTEEPTTTTTVEETISTTELPTTTEGTTTTTTAAPVVQRGRGVARRGGRRGTRPPVQRNIGRNISRHRFSPETSTKGPEERKQTIEEEIIDEIAKNSPATTTEALRPARRRQRKRKRVRVVEEASTDAPLQKSASPTQAERRQSLPTTPLSSDKFYIFNCFGKAIDKFYPDPRDCRLFHYCTQGYNKYQLLDMKFVCDQNTYFDDEKLICTKQKPGRCL